MRSDYKILVACETTGVVRNEFCKAGFSGAWSCDLKPTDMPGNHIQGDVSKLLEQRWDLIIAHPPCQYLAVSGARWNGDVGRSEKQRQAVDFFMSFFDANTKMLAIENPVIQNFGVIPAHTFGLDPWQYGHPYTKRTLFWLRNLPPLKPWYTQKPLGLKSWAHTEVRDPSDRAATFPNIARAMAEQWGACLENNLFSHQVKDE